MTRHAYVIGQPLGHSLSPHMHNAAFQACGIDGRYEAVELGADELGSWVARLAQSDAYGCNVTVPHKEQIIPFLDGLEGDASLCGAVNTVRLVPTRNMPSPPHTAKKVRSIPSPPCAGAGGRVKGRSEVPFPDGALPEHDPPRTTTAIGTNTDTLGFRRSLHEEADATLQGKHVVILGAGGAARAIAVVALQDGAAGLVIANRHMERAARLLGDLRGLAPLATTRAAALDDDLKPTLAAADVVINATSVGLRSQEVPVSPRLIPPRSLVVDIVYNPRQTALLRGAQERGARVLGGLGMLVYQAAAAFELWTSVEAPAEIMRAAAERALDGAA